MLARRESVPVAVHSVIEPEIESWTGDADAASRSDSLDLRSCLASLYRCRWWAVGVMAVALIAAVTYLLTAKPVYESRVKLLIDSQNPNVVSFKEVLEQNSEKLDYYETQLGILRSRTLARKTMDRLNLWNHPDLASHGPGRLKRLAGRFIPAWRAEAPHADETAAQSHAIDAFLKSLTISYRADNRLVDVGFRSTDPHVAANVANTLGRAYIDQSLELKLNASKEAADWLNARLAEQRTQVETSELSLQRYREQNDDVSLSDRQNVITQKLGELSTAATKAKTERIEAESQYQQLQALQDNPAMADALPSVLSNSLITQLKADLTTLQREHASLSEQLGEKHPDLVKVTTAIARVEGQLRAEIAKVAAASRNQVMALREKERNLSAALESQERLALALNRRGIQYGALQREVATNRQIFEALLERAKQTQISSELRVGNTQIVDPAEIPQTPAAPQPLLVLLLALFLGLPLGVATALLVDHFDDRLQSPDEIKMSLGLRFLGFAPAIARSAGAPRASLVQAAGISPEYAEALRTVRANLFLAAPGEATNVLLVTSTGPGEGKTVTAANLAIALAQAGRRVLLIDADMRRCQVHEMFAAPLDPGLSPVLEGRAAMKHAIRPSHVDGLSIVTAGTTPANPADLLEGAAFANAIATVSDRFDWIIIDSPPVMVASDTTSLARIATAILFVVGAEMTTPRHARAALEQLESVRTKIVGAVLSRGKAYRYSPYYAYQARSYSRYASRR